MKVVIDTTVIGQGFNSRSAELRLLKNFLERTNAELCVPGVVYDEAINLVRKSIEQLNTSVNATQRLTGDEKTYPKIDAKKGLAAYSRALDALIKDLKGSVLPYPTVSHQELAKRSLTANKPFVPSGRGYRDALTWFSILEIAAKSDEEIVFISANSDDWCQTKKDVQLHQDLTSDLKHRGISASRVRFFSSLGQFSEECAVPILPISSAADDLKKPAPDYQQLLIDGKQLVEGLLAHGLPEFLRTLSRSDARVADLEVLAISAPTEIQADPVRLVDSTRRLLHFSAEYRVALQCLIQESDLAVWTERLSIHLRAHRGDGQVQVQATVSVRAYFHLIQSGEETDGFSITSISPPNKCDMEYLGVNPIAIRFGQTELHASHHMTLGVVKCGSCGEHFGFGCHKLRPTDKKEEYAYQVEKLLAADHAAGRPHKIAYELVA